MRETAIVIATGHFHDLHGKTTHALLRSSRRYEIVGVIEPSLAGRDAGEELDGRARGIPIFASVDEALARLNPVPVNCIIGVATAGGVLPPAVRQALVEAARGGLTLVNGLHQLLADDEELVRLTRNHGGGIVDVRRPRPAKELRFWSGEVLQIPALRIPVLGTDCATGKRTTCTMLRDACCEQGIRAAMIYTGQTGWLQGNRYGFIFDATLNDFVCGELERAVLECWREERPEVIFIEGQAALRNPSGPCGSEWIVSLGAAGVILQHPAGRRFYVDNTLGLELRPLDEELELIRLLGSEVWAVTLNQRELPPERAEPTRAELEADLGVPVVLPFRDGVGRVVEVIRSRLAGSKP